MEAVKEKAVLVGIRKRGEDDKTFAYRLEELKGLTEAAGGEVVGVLTQAREKPSPSIYIGKGKLEELKHLTAEKEADLVIFDQELSPVQIRNLKEALEGIKIVDRTLLILDIFSQRARSREGILQVELARLNYKLPRLTGKGKEMSRLGGGIGTRGAGEQKLELDKRHIRRRIGEIERQLEKVRKTRELHRKKRQRSGLKEIALVGYTNAGKSTLFNLLCRVLHERKSEEVEADDRLFQTLDTTTRRIKLKGGREVLITDTVGFIQDLPHHLVAAFRSTLEETVYADILLHVVDISDPEYLSKIETVEKVLKDLGADNQEILTVYNKVDLLEGIPHENPNGIYISARTGKGLEVLLEKIAGMLD
ncbi:GTP-binding protein HflX [Thermosyntropha lipolytica DSM 11003]|uniref:GTPase HflX n=1 Tax=Thermosyntropha lipolytica DSM 11003 TaxID=1123382 RepID=A0A1M5PUR0_9FIRM|nr:GTPase HflX [Thermosyntropha lipolytica]SHH05189.1 GTP-binding protein HflX [Thermosyntropha lipolytica DSM 11003]